MSCKRDIRANTWIRLWQLSRVVVFASMSPGRKVPTEKSGGLYNRTSLMHSDKKLLLGNLFPKLMTIRKSETDERVAKIWDVNMIFFKTASDVKKL